MEIKPVKLYVNKGLISKDHSYIPLLYPLLGQIVKPEAPYEAVAYRSHGFDSRYIEFVSDARECEYVVFPHRFYWARERPALFAAVKKEAERAGKLLLIDDTADARGPALPRRAIALRYASYRFARAANELIVPLPAEDLLESHFEGKLELRQKVTEPSIGFVGWSRISLQTHAKAYAKEVPIRLRALIDNRYNSMEKGIFWRQAAMDALSQTSGLHARFVERGIFGGRTDTAEDAVVWRKEFVENLRDSDYALCVKGDVNVSFRFYEALSMGRIPLLIDTECVLPLEHIVDYRSFCVVVDSRDVDRAGEILMEFHSSCSVEQFEGMQRKAREAYERYLRLDSFTPQMAMILKEQASIQ